MTDSVRSVAAVALLSVAFVSADAQSWTITAPQSVSLERGSKIPLQITATKPLTGLHVTAVRLQDATNLQLIHSDSVQLAANGVCARTAGYNPAQDRPLSLCLGGTAPGMYVGVVAVAADTGAPAVIPLTVFASSRRARMLGLGMIALGTILSWIVTVFIRRVAAQTEAKLPAAHVKEQLERLRDRLAEAENKIGGGWKATGLPKRIATELGRLETKELVRVGLPRILTFAFKPNPDVPASYAAHIESVGARAGVLETLVTGIEQAGTLQGVHVTPARRVIAATEIDKCEDVRPLTAAEASVCVQAKIDVMLADPNAPRAAAAPGGKSGELPSTKELYLVQGILSGVTWVLWAVLTISAGYAALVNSNLGFGTETDLIKAFLWGLGVQTAGQTLQQLAPTSVSSSLSLSLPKG